MNLYIVPNKIVALEQAAHLNNAHLWTMAEFFDRCAQFAFLENNNLVRDDAYVSVHITRKLAERGIELRKAGYFQSLLNKIYYGNQKVAAVLEAALVLGFKREQIEVLSLLAEIENELLCHPCVGRDPGAQADHKTLLDSRLRGNDNRSVVTKAMALFHAFSCKQQLQYFFSSLRFDAVYVVGVDTLSVLEKNLLQCSFPDYEFKNVEEKASITFYSSITPMPYDQGDWAAELINHLRDELNDVPSIAIVLGNPQEKAAHYGHALRRMNIPFVASRTKTLSYAPMVLLRYLFFLKIYGEKKEYLNFIQSHACFNGQLNYIQVFQDQASIHEYLQQTLDVLEHTITFDDKEFFTALREKILYLMNNFSEDTSILPLKTFFEWFESVASQISLTREKKVDDATVEILSLKEAVGRTFDYIIFGDMVYGEMPSSLPRDAYFSDDDFEALNHHFQSSAFLTEKEFIKRQELSFEGIKKSAAKGLAIVASKHDDAGKEATISALFEATLSAHAQERVDSRCFSPRSVYHSFVEGDYLPSTTLLFEKNAFIDTFSHRFGLSRETPLSPSAIERFALCRFRGFLEGVLKIVVEEEEHDDFDDRMLGNLAHEVLRDFYALDARLRSHDNSLYQLLQQRIPKYKAELTISEKVFDATIDWLYGVLQRLVINIKSDDFLHNFTPKQFECHVAAEDHRSIEVDGHNIFLRGIIDRVDESHDSVLVIDYKMSPKYAIDAKLREKEFLHKHFQIPIYLYLLSQEERYKNKSLLGCLISIKDGERSAVVGYDKYPHIQSMLEDDTHEHERTLKQGLHEVFANVFKGIVQADRGEHCKTCSFAGVCRVGSSE